MILKYTDFILEFKETSRNTATIYKDSNLTVKVVKTYDACKEIGKDTNWCSNYKPSFYKHNLSANMYRFIFKNGYKLRLTWDYIKHDGSYSGGTHWGQGGTVDGKNMTYVYIRPEDEENPFQFDYNKQDDRQYMVDIITNIPDDAKIAVHQYQEERSRDKSELYNSMYKEIEKIKIKNVVEDGGQYYLYQVTIEYRGKEYDISVANTFINYSKEFEKEFKNQYAFNDDSNTLTIYLFDKIKEYLKSNPSSQL